MKKLIRLTYSTVTGESASYGDHATHGSVTRNLTIPAKTYLPKNPAQFTLREAINFCQEHNCGRYPVEADSCPISHRNPPRWFNFISETPYESTISTTVSLHLPRSVTPSSAMRVARFLLTGR